MTLSLSKLMAVADKATPGPYWTDTDYVSAFDPPTVKRLLEIAKAAKEFMNNEGFDEICPVRIDAALDALRAALEGVEP